MGRSLCCGSALPLSSIRFTFYVLRFTFYDPREDPLGMPGTQCRLKGQALEFNDEQREHATRRQAEHEQANKQDDDLPATAGLAGRSQQRRKVGTRNARRWHEVSHEDANVSGAAGDNCGDALGGLGRVATGTDRLAGHDVPRSARIGGRTTAIV